MLARERFTSAKQQLRRKILQVWRLTQVSRSNRTATVSLVDGQVRPAN